MIVTVKSKVGGRAGMHRRNTAPEYTVVLQDLIKAADAPYSNCLTRFRRVSEFAARAPRTARVLM